MIIELSILYVRLIIQMEILEFKYEYKVEYEYMNTILIDEINDLSKILI